MYQQTRQERKERKERKEKESSSLNMFQPAPNNKVSNFITFLSPPSQFHTKLPILSKNPTDNNPKNFIIYKDSNTIIKRFFKVILNVGFGGHSFIFVLFFFFFFPFSLKAKRRRRKEREEMEGKEENIEREEVQCNFYDVRMVVIVGLPGLLLELIVVFSPFFFSSFFFSLRIRKINSFFLPLLPLLPQTPR